MLRSLALGIQTGSAPAPLKDGKKFLRSRPTSILLKGFISFVDSAETAKSGFIFRNEITGSALMPIKRAHPDRTGSWRIICIPSVQSGIKIVGRFTVLRRVESLKLILLCHPKTNCLLNDHDNDHGR